VSGHLAPGASMRGKDGAAPLFSYDVMGWYAGRYVPDGNRAAPGSGPLPMAARRRPDRGAVPAPGSHDIVNPGSFRPFGGQADRLCPQHAGPAGSSTGHGPGR